MDFVAAFSAALKTLDHNGQQQLPLVTLVDCAAQLGLQSVAVSYVRQFEFADTPLQQAHRISLFHGLGYSDEAFRLSYAALDRFPNDIYLTQQLGEMQMCTGFTDDGMKNFSAFSSRSFYEEHRGGMRDNGWNFNRLWEGEAIQGKRFLIIPLGGVGDYVQFIRYAKQLKRLGAARVTVHLPNQRFRGLIESSEGVDEVVEHLSDDMFDWFTDPFGLCVYLQPQVGFVPTERYLKAPISQFAADFLSSVRADAGGRRVIGISWASDMLGGTSRSIALAHLLPLFALKNVYWVVLQRGQALAEFVDLNLAFSCSIVSEASTFDETAAVVEGLDAVVTIDSYMLHLASAVGQKVYFMAGRVMDWRHMNQENTSPWYPNVTMFRQPSLGDWRDVVDRIVVTLKTDES